MTNEEKKKNESIARVAYLIAASDGKAKKEEREAFAKTLQAIHGFDFGEPDTTAFIEKVLSDADNLIRLREFYNDEQMIKALMTKVAADVMAIKNDQLALRKAFAVWVNICVSDGTYSNFERKIIKGLQAASNSLRTPSTLGELFGGTGLPCLGPVSMMVDLTVALCRVAVKPEQKFGANAAISDEFLAEVESRCDAINQLGQQLSKSKDKAEKEEIKFAIEGLIDSFNDFIKDFSTTKGE